mgnify:CR=1 FL=1|tara:strand:- start:55 stop:495 length:441 start_codon:yes stop_codon:yes gene_type:complete
MYNYEANVTYLNDYDNSCGKEDIQEIQEYRQHLYQMDLLKVFGAKNINTLQDLDNNKNIDNINSDMSQIITEELLPICNNNENIKTLIKLSNKMWLTEDDKTGFLGLFAYDYFYYLHRILHCVHNTSTNINTMFNDNYNILYNKLK